MGWDRTKRHQPFIVAEWFCPQYPECQYTGWENTHSWETGQAHASPRSQESPPSGQLVGVPTYWEKSGDCWHCWHWLRTDLAPVLSVADGSAYLVVTTCAAHFSRFQITSPSWLLHIIIVMVLWKRRERLWPRLSEMVANFKWFKVKDMVNLWYVTSCEWQSSKKIIGFISYSSATFQMDHTRIQGQKIPALHFASNLLTLLI